MDFPLYGHRSTWPLSVGHRPVISEKGHLHRSPENDIQKSISSVRNVREKKPMAPVKMSENTNKTGHLKRSYWL